MGQELYCEFHVKSDRNLAYWWSLIFEAMHWRSFGFTAPDEPRGTGYYYYIRLGNASETDFVKASFRTAWDEINAGTSQILISLWDADQQSFPIDVSLEKKEMSTLCILLSLSDAYLVDLSLEQAVKRINQVLDCAKAIDEMCQPYLGKIYWEDMIGPWAFFGDSPEVLSFVRSEQERIKKKFLEKRQPNGRIIYILETIPVKIRGGWDFVSLME